MMRVFQKKLKQYKLQSIALYTRYLVDGSGPLKTRTFFRAQAFFTRLSVLPVFMLGF